MPDFPAFFVPASSRFRSCLSLCQLLPCSLPCFVCLHTELPLVSCLYPCIVSALCVVCPAGSRPPHLDSDLPLLPAPTWYRRSADCPAECRDPACWTPPLVLPLSAFHAEHHKSVPSLSCVQCRTRVRSLALHMGLPPSYTARVVPFHYQACSTNHLLVVVQAELYKTDRAFSINLLEEITYEDSINLSTFYGWLEGGQVSLMMLTSGSMFNAFCMLIVSCKALC